MHEQHTGGFFARIAELSVFILLGFLALFFVPVPWVPITHAKMVLLTALLVTGFVAWGITRFKQGTLAIPKDWILVGAVLIPLSYAVSLLFTENIPTSFVGYGIERDTVTAITMWFIAFALAAFALHSYRAILSGYRLVLIGGLFVAFFTLVRLVAPFSLLDLGGVLSGKTASVVGSWHDLAAFLGLLVLMAGAYLAQSGVDRARYVAWAVYAASLVLLALINMLDVWIVLGAASFVALSVAAFRMRTQQRQLLPLVLFALPLILSGTLYFFGSNVQQILPERLQTAQIEVRPSWEGTVAVAAAVYDGARALTGSGPNTFVREWAKAKPAGVNETVFWNADFVQGVGFIPTAFITTGIIGVLAWVIFLCAVLYRGTRLIVGSKALDERAWFVGLGIVIATLYLWGLHIMYPSGVALIALAFLLTGVCVALGRVSGSVSKFVIGGDEQPRARFIVYIGAVVVIAGALYAGAMTGRAMAAELFVNRAAAVYQTSTDLARAQQYVQQALSIAPNNDRAHRAAVELGFIQLNALIQKGGEDTEQLRNELQQVLQTSIQHGLAAVNGNAYDYQNWLALARGYEQLVGAQVQGAYEEARKAYERAVQENPSNPFPYLQLARLAFTQGKAEEGVAFLNQSLQVKQNYAPALLLQMQLLVSANDLQSAQAVAVGLVQAVPEEPVAWFYLGSILFSTGQFTDAAAAFEQAVVRNSQYADALYLLSASYLRIGRAEDAVRALEVVTQLNPTSAEASAALETARQAAAAAKETSTGE